MKFTRIFAVFVLLSLVAIPALGELTDYQKGVMDGMKAGLRMGKLLGAAPYDPAQAQEYANMVETFNQGLSSIFGENTEAIKMFWMSPLPGYSPSTFSNKPIHAIDASWNQTNKTVLGDQDTGRIYGMPASAYYSWIDPRSVPALPYSGITDSEGKKINYDNLGGV